MPTAYAPLIKTKIAMPPVRSHAVVRQKLLELLEEGVTHPLTLVSAPAGYGKTTLVTSWVHETGRQPRVAWLSVDADDSDPVHFVYYLTATLQAIEPRVGRAPIYLLGSLKMPEPSDLISLLLNELAETEEPIVLVLDDYHTVNSSEVDAAVAFLIEHMRERLRLVISTREEPKLPLARWRSLDRVFEIGEENLRFSDEEAVAFFRQTMGINIDPKAARTLEARTEGWVAALQMAGLSLRLNGDDGSSIVSGGTAAALGGRHRYLVNYFADEVLKGQSEETRAFLRRTSVLDRLCPSLCDALTGRSDGALQLERLEQGNMFLIPLDDAQQWYRYHQLFLDYLRSPIPETEKRELHAIASAWFEANGLGEEAIKHALAANDIDASVRIVRAQAEDTLSRGQIPTVLSWLRVLPESVVRANPDLAGYKAWLLYMRGHSAEAETYAAYARPGAVAEPVPRFDQLLSFQTFLALNWSDPSEAIPLAKQALERLGDEASFFRPYVLCMLGQAQDLTHDRRAAVNTLRQAVASAQQLGNRLMAADAVGHLALVLAAQGQLREANLLCHNASDEQINGDDHPLPIAGLVYVPLGVLQYEADELQAARHSLTTGINLCDQVGMAYFKVVGKCALAKLQHVSGEIEGAWNTLAAAREVSDQPHSPRRQRLVALASAELQLREGNIEAAAQTLDDLRKLTGQPSERESMLQVRLMLAQHNPSGAWKILAALEETASRQRSDGILVAVHILQALCKRSLNQPVGAQEHLASAVSLAASPGYRRVFLDEGAHLIPLLEQVRHLAPAFVASLLELPAREQTARTAGPLVEPLSKIEFEILRLLDKGMTNQEIADRLAMTVGTTKWRMNQIFGKLQVRNRIEALVRARQLRLL